VHFILYSKAKCCKKAIRLLARPNALQCSSEISCASTFQTVVDRSPVGSVPDWRVLFAVRNISRHLDTVIVTRPRGDRIRVYCFRGGKRSRLWFDALDTIRYRVERLPGVWKGSRRWVNEQLETRPREFSYLVLSESTGCGKTRLLEQLSAEGAQVFDLEAIAAHRGSVIGAIPGVSQPPQKYFDSLPLQKLSTFSAMRPVWVEAESKKIGNVHLSLSLFETMHLTGTLLQVRSRQFLTRYTPLGPLALRSSLRIFTAKKKARIYAVRSEVNILVNPSVARKRQSAAKLYD